MLIVVTNRLLCKDDFLYRIEKIAQCKPEKIILREKDMTKEEYTLLALQCKKICEKYGVTLVINSFFDVAIKLGIKSIHIPFSVFIARDDWDDFDEIGVSIHSIDEAKALNGARANYIIAGHIFPTDCKKDIEPRGLDFLKEVCRNTDLPVFGIGGINAERMPDVLNCGADGVCVMSEMMTCENIKDAIVQYHK